MTPLIFFVSNPRRFMHLPIEMALYSRPRNPRKLSSRMMSPAERDSALSRVSGSLRKVSMASSQSLGSSKRRLWSVRSLISHSLYFIAFSNSSFMTSTPGKPLVRYVLSPLEL